jgi:phosphatidylglycerophosphatase A
MTNTSIFLFIAQLGGLGKAPFAPGTVATIVAGIPSAYLLSLAGESWALLLLVLLFIFSCYVADVAETELQKTDPGEVVIDELIGFLVTMFGFPFTSQTLVLGIVSFRLLDIWKPWPIRLIDTKLRGGFGIIMDDVAAGIIAHALVWAGVRIMSLMR